MRSVAIRRKNYLFVGAQTGGEAAAIAYTLFETAKLNGIDTQAWLADTLARIPDYRINRVDDMPPWKTAQKHGQTGRLPRLDISGISTQAFRDALSEEFVS